MSFAAFPLSTLAWIAGGIGALVLAFYLLRRTPSPQVVSNVTFWMRAAQSSKPRFLRSTRIPWAAFLVSLLIALLLVGELGDPRFGSGVRGTTVIVLAAGRSMNAHFQGQRRIDRGLDEVRRWVGRTTASGSVAVVRAGMEPETLMPLTEDAAELDRALDGFSVDDGPADLDAALGLADEIVRRSGEAGQILLIADRDVDRETQTHRVLIPVGASADTIAISAFAARRDPTAAGEYSVTCTVESFSSRRARLRLLVQDGEVPILDRRLTLTAGQAVTLRGQGFSAAAAELTAELLDVELAGGEDALDLDDRAYAAVPPLEPMRVLLATPGNSYLEGALSVHPNVRFERVSPAAVAGRSTEDLAGYHVVILDHASLGAGVEHPGLLTFDSDGGPVMPGQGLRRPPLTASMASHPVLNGVRMTGLHIDRAHALDTEPGDQVIMRSGQDALAVARESEAGRVVAFGFVSTDSDLIRRDAFPLVLHHSMSWLSARANESPMPRRLGRRLRVPEGQTLLGPDGEGVAVQGGAIDRVREIGIYHVGEQAVAYSATEHARQLSAGATGGHFQTDDPLPPLAALIAAAILLLMIVEYVLVHRGRLG